MPGLVDPRLSGWQERASRRTDEAVRAMSQVPGVIAVIVGGSMGRDEHWPLSDIDLMVVSAEHPVAEVAARVDMCAYQMSEMWGTSGIYTAVDAGKITFDLAEAESVSTGSPTDSATALSDPRVFHGIDKMFGGYAAYDPHGVGHALLDWSARHRFTEPVVAGRTSHWLSSAHAAAESSERLASSDPTAAWNLIRRAGTALAEAALEKRRLRTGSLGRFWTRFEHLLEEHDASPLAEGLTSACHARADQELSERMPEWLTSRIELSLAARVLVGESVTAEQNARDVVLAYTGLYRTRFPRATDEWLRPWSSARVDLASARLRELCHEVRAG
ncbi:nucleotidyltransferase domain-containing protein [Nesterenkonia ebinurensis]|uniref:nucleotidyltransferase domain-containing protein n=1 Tax=Nesterenkonia ebinurensis TaxID=2608252 RepID=UPI00123DC175|nr:nucleotidyltransferase domain-containing protein [Nesterenkonia ebinurensis]